MSSNGLASAPAPSPPDRGRRLIPAVIDRLAREDPLRIWASLPYDESDLAKGYEEINYRRLAACIDRLSWLLAREIGTSSSFETIAYFGNVDLRYPMMEMVACKTGHKVLFSSQLNSEDIHVSLLEELKVKAVISATAVDVSGLLARWPVANVVIPELDELLSEAAEEAAAEEAKGTAKTEEGHYYPYTKTFEEAQFDPFLVLHTSGTTGRPKPVVWNHAMMAALDSHPLLPDVEGRRHNVSWLQMTQDQRFLIPGPPSHAMAAILSFVTPVFGGGVLVCALRHRLARPEEITAVIEHGRVNRAIVTPWILDDIARKPDAEEHMKRLEMVLYGGANLSSYAAEKWAKHTHIQNMWGSTEVMVLPFLEARADEYEYIVIDPVHSGLEFRPVEGISASGGSGSGSGSGTNSEEAQVYRAYVTLTPASAATSTFHKSLGLTHAVDAEDGGSGAHPELDVGDLFTPHPDPARARYVWRFVGRADDVLTFSTGLNINRGELERDLASHERVRAALLVGAGHQQAVLLVELADGVSVEEAAAEDLWEAAVEPVNRRATLQGCVGRTHVVMVPCGGFVRTGKGSVVRRATEQKFAAEVDAVYANFGDKLPTRL